MSYFVSITEASYNTVKVRHKYDVLCINDVLRKLEASKLGCYIKQLCCNSIMYADDLILISISICDMQSLVKLCVEEFNNIGLDINISKSARLRIGIRHAAPVSSITVNNHILKCVNEINYLGINILSSKKFTVNLQCMKQKYFRSLNGIFEKVGLKTSPLVLMTLIDPFSFQICFTVQKVFRG